MSDEARFYLDGYICPSPQEVRRDHHYINFVSDPHWTIFIWQQDKWGRGRLFKHDAKSGCMELASTGSSHASSETRCSPVADRWGSFRTGWLAWDYIIDWPAISCDFFLLGYIIMQYVYMQRPFNNLEDLQRTITNVFDLRSSHGEAAEFNLPCRLVALRLEVARWKAIDFKLWVENMLFQKLPTS
jgi:hypothetical protein